MQKNWTISVWNCCHVLLSTAPLFRCSSARVHGAMHNFYLWKNALCGIFHVRTQLSLQWHSIKHKGQHDCTEMMTTMSCISIQFMECALFLWFSAMLKFDLIHINSFGSDIRIVLYRPNPSVGRSLWTHRILCQINSHINMAIWRNKHERVLICVLEIWSNKFFSLLYKQVHKTFLGRCARKHCLYNGFTFIFSRMEMAREEEEVSLDGNRKCDVQW